LLLSSCTVSPRKNSEQSAPEHSDSKRTQWHVIRGKRTPPGQPYITGHRSLAFTVRSTRLSTIVGAAGTYLELREHFCLVSMQLGGAERLHRRAGACRTSEQRWPVGQNTLSNRHRVDNVRDDCTAA
jgi:hypothetical protein